jgi:hypothetical protein
VIILQTLADEFAITVSNAAIWQAMLIALLFAAVSFGVGVLVSRIVGLIRPGASAVETVGVGLAVGLIVLAAWWAALWSGGRSSFTPVAVAFAVAVAIGALSRLRDRDAPYSGDLTDENGLSHANRSIRSMVAVVLCGGLFIVAAGLLNASTMAPSPRDGEQPVEFNDEAFYAILGRDLATSGTESNLTASGFSNLPGVPTQTWYHWGELWLASAVIALFGVAPVLARHIVVLPAVLLAVAMVTGVVVQRVTRTRSRGAFLFGFFVSLLLAPIPDIGGPFFAQFATGMMFGITLYGLSAVAVVVSLYAVAVLNDRPPTWAFVLFVSTIIAFILPAHLAVAILVFVGVLGIAAFRLGVTLATERRLYLPSPVSRRVLGTTGVLVLATVAWGVATGHAMGAGGSTVVSPFNDVWRDSVTVSVLGFGALLSVVVAIPIVFDQDRLQVNLFVGTVALLIVGAIGWGARLGDFTMFYLFYAGIAVIATPIAAVAARTLWVWMQTTGHRPVAVTLAAICIAQLGFGLATNLTHMQRLGSVAYAPVPVALLDDIRQLPADAKLAYACGAFSESSLGVPQLGTIDAHTDRRVVPLCYNAELLSSLIGATLSDDVPNLNFALAPQRMLYPNKHADPSSAAVSAFMKDHGIDYIYVDAQHPNTLVADAVPVASSGSSAVLRVP